MERVTIKDIVNVTGGVLLCGEESYEIKNFCTDSRKMKEHELFVPIIGERVDGHDYIEVALQHGGATLTQKHETMIGSNPWIFVKDTVKAMQQIARWYREKMEFPVVAVTGSVGKTTTREMITRALEAEFSVFHTEGNYNSQVGVPLTIARMTGEEQVAVLEAGMSQVGEMTQLEAMIRPNVVVFTNIGVAHIENLGTQDHICKEKMELAKHIDHNGAIILNGDDAILMAHKEEFLGTVITYGKGSHCDYQAKDIQIRDGKTTFVCVNDGKETAITMDVLGEHNVLNALASFAVCKWIGLSLEQVKHQFEQFQGTRQQVHTVNGYMVIDDTYNASPDSMKASIAVLAHMPCDGKKIAVLADMLELGEKTEQYHREVGAFLGEKQIEELYTLGEYSKALFDEAKKKYPKLEGKTFMDREQLSVTIKQRLQKGDCILLKGSNGMKLSELAKQLLK